MIIGRIKVSKNRKILIAPFSEFKLYNNKGIEIPYVTNAPCNHAIRKSESRFFTIKYINLTIGTTNKIILSINKIELHPINEH